LKPGKASRSNFGSDRLGSAIDSNFGKASRSGCGQEVRGGAPMMASAASDTTESVTRLEGPCSTASGSLSCGALYGVSATCVPGRDPGRPVAILLTVKSANKKAVAWTIQRRRAR
jgi:hypothetical protein